MTVSSDNIEIVIGNITITPMDIPQNTTELTFTPVNDNQTIVQTGLGGTQVMQKRVTNPYMLTIPFLIGSELFKTVVSVLQTAVTPLEGSLTTKDNCHYILEGITLNNYATDTSVMLDESQSHKVMVNVHNVRSTL